MSRVHEVVLADRRIEEVQLRIKEQKARLQRMIVQGFPSQSDDGLLSRLYVNLCKLQETALAATRAATDNFPLPLLSAIGTDATATQ